MTHSEEELRRLADAATPGPWTVHPFVDAIHIRDRNERNVVELSDRAISDCGMPPENARFIAAARTAIPELLDALEAARKDAAELREELKLWKPMTEEEAEAAYAEAEAVPLEPGEAEAMVERMLARVNDPAYRPTEPEYVRLVHMVRTLQTQQVESLLAIAAARMQRDTARSEVSELRRQLEGLGIKGEET